jgi:lambda family phage tail tape measure protein
MAGGVQVGTLSVNLTAGTAAFESGMAKAGQTAKSTGKDIQSSFNQAAKAGKDFGESTTVNMMEAKGSMMLLGEEVGVRIPRHLQTLIAQIPGVSAAFAAMLPLVGVLAAVGLILKVIEHHEKLAEAIRKTALENENLTIKQDDQTKSMELTNLKLDDQIAKLEGRPGKNRLAEALLESSIAADKLAASFSEDFRKIDEEVQTSATFLGGLKMFWTQLAEHPLISNLGGGVKGIQSALESVNEAMMAVDTARRSLDDAKGQEAQLAAIQGQQKAYANLRADTEAAMNLVKQLTPGNTELIGKLSQEATVAASAMKDMSLQADALNKNVKIAGLESKQDIQGPKDKTAEGAINNQKLIQDALAVSLEKRNELENASAMNSINAAQTAAKAKGEIDADLEKQKLVLIQKETDDAEAALRTQYDNELTAQQGRLAILKTEGPTKLDEIAKINAELAASAIKLEGELEANQKKGLDAQAAAEKENAAVELEIAKKLIEDKRHLSEESTKFNEEMIKLNEASAKEQADWNYKMGLTTLTQHLDMLKQDAAQELAEEKAKNQAVFDNSSQLELDLEKWRDADLLADAKYHQKLVVIAQQSNNTMADGFKNFFNQYINDGKTAAQQTTEVMNQAMTGLTNNLADMITSGKANWHDYVNTIEKDLEKLALNNMLKSLLGLIPGMGSSGSGGLGGIISGIFGGGGGVPAMATGGSASPGSLYTVGETGKEWFMPSVAGTIIPNAGSAGQKAGGSSTVVNQNFNISTPNKDSFMASQDQILGASQAAAFRAARRNN